MAEKVEGQEVESKITLDPRGFQDGAARAAAAAARLRDEFRRAGDSMRRDLQTVAADMRGQIMSATRSMAGAFGGLVDVLATTKVGLAGLAVVAVGAGLAKVATSTAEATESVMDLARSLGVGTQEAYLFKEALADIGAPTSELEAAAKGLSRNLRENEDDMNKFGLRTRDAAGNLRPMNELLLDGIRVVNEYKAGADRTIAAQTIFGRAIDGSSKLLLLNKEVIESNLESMDKLGMKIGAEATQAWKDFDAASDSAAQGMRALGEVIGDAFLPVLTKLTSSFASTLPAVVEKVRDTLRSLGTAFLAVRFSVMALGEVINTFLFAAGWPMVAVLSAIGRAMTGDFKGAADVLAGVPQTITDRWRASFAAIRQESAAAAAQIDALWVDDKKPGSTGGVEGTRTAPDLKKDKKDKKDKPESMMPYYEAMLEEERQLAAERDALHGMSKQAEAAFWADLLASAKLSEDDRLAVGKKAAAARVAVLQQEAREAQQIQGIGLAAWRDAELAKIDLDEEGARNRVALGAATQAELLAQEQAFEQRRYEIRLAALQASAAVLDPQKDPVQLAQINTQIEALEQAHQLRLKTIRGQIAVESAAELNAIWEDLGRRVSSLWDQGVNAMMNGTLTWRNAMRAVGAEMVAWFSGVVKHQVATWVLGEQGKTAATAAGSAQRLMMETLSAAKSVALWAATAVKNIMTSAWEAMAGAYKAIVGIPYVGPFLAPAAAGAAFVTVAGIAGRVVSAAGGYDIPAGVNPLTQLHSREMVLPAKYADMVRNSTSGGTGGAPINVTMQISTPDADSFRAAGDRITGDLHRRLADLRRGV